MKKAIARILLYVAWCLNMLFGIFGYVILDNAIQEEE